jgi:secondary thiamine-phosphate synthase enzyme
MIVTETFSINTKGRCDLVDITSKVAEIVTQSGIKEGNVTVFVPGSTAGVTTTEFEPGLIADLKAAWERLVPENLHYLHDSTWGDANGFSHVRASLLGASLVVPFIEGELHLGTWQQIVVIDFDNRTRYRNIIVQVFG